VDRFIAFLRTRESVRRTREESLSIATASEQRWFAVPRARPEPFIGETGICCSVPHQLPGPCVLVLSWARGCDGMRSPRRSVNPGE
jgi:hypothetical protein